MSKRPLAIRARVRLFRDDQRWYETKGYPAPPGAILIFNDITAKKMALNKLSALTEPQYEKVARGGHTIPQ